MRSLVLNVKREFFEQIKRGEKSEEFRLTTPYWKKRLEGRKYSGVIICLGYPAGHDTTRRLVFPWNGIDRRIIQHDHFGSSPVEVYAIKLTSEKGARDGRN